MTPLQKIKKQRGFALVIVLWVLMLLGIIAGGFLRDTRTETNVARNLLENAKAEALADAGVQRAMLGLLDQDDATAWRADGTPYAFSLGEGTASIRLRSEAGKIDLNTAPDEVLQGLFMAVGLSQEEAAQLVDAAVDFRDPDSIRRPGGAEDADYESIGRSTGAKNAPYETIEELMQVRGISRDLYDRVSSAITVYGRRQVDVTTAPPLVIQVLRSVMPEKLDRMIAARQASAVRLSRPRIITVTVEGRTSNGGLFVREAVIQRTGGPQPFRILAWRQRWTRTAEQH